MSSTPPSSKGSLPPLDDPNIMSRGWRRAVHLSSYVLCAAAAWYFVLEHDFGNREHVFSPIRRHYRQALHRAFARPLPPSDEPAPPNRST